MKKLVILSSTILFICFLSILAFTIVHVQKGGQKLGSLTKPIKQLSEFPQTILDVVKEFTNPETLVSLGHNFTKINPLKDDLYSLNGKYTVNNNWEINLENLNNDNHLIEDQNNAKLFIFNDKELVS